MNEWTRYRLQDFIPFTEEVYVRLMERMGETFWPLHLLTLTLGGAALVLALKGRQRPAFLLVAPVWIFIAVAFFMQRYANLNWAGHYVGYAFFAQAFIMVLIALAGRGGSHSLRRNAPGVIAGGLLVLFGLIGQPVMAPLGGGTWSQAQVFGVHPDPTAITSLGLVLIGLRGLAMWFAAIIPALWILISGLTWLALGTTEAPVLFSVLAVCAVGLIWRGSARE